MRVFFNTDDNLVLEDIPDDMMAEIERRALLNERTTKEEVRSIIVGSFGEPQSE